MNELHIVYKVILGCVVLYMVGFFMWCPIGLLMENAIKNARKKSILQSLDQALNLSYSEAEFKKNIENSTSNLGGVIDEMVRSKSIIRTPVLEPSPHWQITRHPQQC